MICPRCKREVHPWLLKRQDVCSAPDWAYCIRQYADVQADIQKRAAKWIQRSLAKDLTGQVADGYSPPVRVGGSEWFR